MNRIEKAKEFAEIKHIKQKYGEHPYIYHLNMVYNVLLEANINKEDILVAAYLHDSLEDTPTTKMELEEIFGDTVASLVEAVTGRGHNRKTRNLNAYEKIITLGDDAATLKFADRLANFRASVNDVNKHAMYLKEWNSFSEALSGLGDQKLWAILKNEFETKKII